MPTAKHQGSATYTRKKPDQIIVEPSGGQATEQSHLYFQVAVEAIDLLNGMQATGALAAGRSDLLRSAASERQGPAGRTAFTFFVWPPCRISVYLSLTATRQTLSLTVIIDSGS